MLLYPRLFYSYFVSQIHYFSNFLGNFKMKPPFLIFAPGWHKIMDSIEVNRVDFNAVLDMVKSQPESALSGTSLSLIERCHVQRLALTLRCATNFVQFYYWVSWICRSCPITQESGDTLSPLSENGFVFVLFTFLYKTMHARLNNLSFWIYESTLLSFTSS